MTGIYLPIAFLVLFLAIFGTIIGWWLKTRNWYFIGVGLAFFIGYLIGMTFVPEPMNVFAVMMGFVGEMFLLFGIFNIKFENDT